MADQTARMRQLADTLNQASQAYYFGSEPIMSDMDWDKLYDELSALEKETGIVLPDSPTHRVGGEVMTAFAPHTHIHRLWSMDKAQSIGAVEDWIRRTEKLSGQDDLQYCVEYKFDGLTLNLTYNEGRLIQAATRGNGITGEAILPQAKTIRTVPLTIPYQGLLEVQGECIMRLSALDTYNKTAKEPLKNARNAAAGALRNLDPAVTASRHLDAFFYQIGTIDNPPYTTQQGMLDFLRANGFQVSPYLGQCRSIREIEDCIHHIEEERSSLDFLIDGVLSKVSDLSTREMMGYTDRFPRWAIAFKFEAEETTTVIRDVTWDVGRTGKLTPVAHVEPVDFYGVTVRKATLNNWGDIQRKRVAIGARVWIRRSNDVIAEIMGHVGDSEEGDTPIVRPEVCPACGEKLIDRGAHIFCMNRVSCRPQAVARISHFASRDAMDIEGLSEKTAGQLYDQMNVRDPAGVDSLTREQVLWLDGVERKYVEEGGGMNVMFKINGTVVTPMLTGSILRGVTRKSCIELLKSWNVPVEERLLSVDELFEAAKNGTLEEAWCVGTAAVISPIGELAWNDEVYEVNQNRIGALSQKLYDELTGIQWGTRPDPFGWTCVV